MGIKFFLSIALGFSLIACTSDSKPPAAPETSSNSNEEVSVKPVDYSKGRAMNKRLGKGINLGNSWDSQGYDDGGWSNPIEDNFFKIISNAGFNSIRLPVRWQFDSDYGSHTVSPDRLAGVKEDIQLAIDNGLAVIVDFHHYVELFDLGNAANRGNADSVALFAKEKEHFLAMWKQVATELDVFPDSLLVYDVMNEPTIANADIVNDLTMSAYEVIRAAAPGKTIMFEAYHAAKFADLEVLKLPEDGNIIYSGHYYEPYTFSHQGNGYACKGDEAYSNTAKADIKNYAALATKLYPDVNGGHIPMNMGEFGISGQSNWQCDKDGPSDKYKSMWTKLTIEAAETYDISWHYWGFVGVGGFEAYDKYENKWLPGFPTAFGL
ncbi:MAG: glycoside hydrolase family 5 protein [Fibrobacter sp.]|nr:glycoside hydrolase family 5 protein [Fibrobacter sp.]